MSAKKTLFNRKSGDNLADLIFDIFTRKRIQLQVYKRLRRVIGFKLQVAPTIADVQHTNACSRTHFKGISFKRFAYLLRCVWCTFFSFFVFIIVRFDFWEWNHEKICDFFIWLILEISIQHTWISDYICRLVFFFFAWSIDKHWFSSYSRNNLQRSLTLWLFSRIWYGTWFDISKRHLIYN